jgi:hypothetical protein
VPKTGVVLDDEGDGEQQSQSGGYPIASDVFTARNLSSSLLGL